MNELIAALRRDRMDEFKSRFRRIDVLIVDDVQFLAGRERTQEEFFHTFNSLYESHHQIVLTSDKFPKEIPDLEERLRNRFEWGLIADIQPPDMETRVAILEKKAELESIELPQEVAIFLATNIDSNVRELGGLADPPRRVRLAQQVSDHRGLRPRGIAERAARPRRARRSRSSRSRRPSATSSASARTSCVRRSARAPSRCRARWRCISAAATPTPRFRSSATASAAATTRRSSTPPRSSSAGCARTPTFRATVERLERLLGTAQLSVQ